MLETDVLAWPQTRLDRWAAFYRYRARLDREANAERAGAKARPSSRRR